MSIAATATIAVTFMWVGLVVGISFIEAPLKFRAPGVTVPIGLGIGRLVFKALNSVEAALVVVLVLALVLDPPALVTLVPLGLAAAALTAQLVFVRPRLTRRTNAVLAGDDAPRSHAHHAYIALETAKLVALLIGGVAALAAA
ncbi:hypothetical protein [Allokutzneria oryzae]|uniref:DUF4149 domain-containing protein n=1 Tax=Allokutzneria oryzae TaxID=1378989 RepID=A0ABV6A921_9PSEU